MIAMAAAGAQLVIVPHRELIGLAVIRDNLTSRSGMTFSQ
jgi:hypothetical protein